MYFLLPYSAIHVQGYSWNEDTLIYRTHLTVPKHPIHLHYIPWNQDTSLMRTLSSASRVSGLERFHHNTYMNHCLFHTCGPVISCWSIYSCTYNIMIHTLCVRKWAHKLSTITGRSLRSRRLPATVFDPFQDYSKSTLCTYTSFIRVHVCEYVLPISRPHA